MSQKLQILAAELKRARSLSYYGKYPEAIEQFEKVQSSIVGQIFHIADKTLLNQWNKFLEEIKYEKNLVQATVQMLSGKVDVKIPTKQMRQVWVDSSNGQISSNGSFKKISQGYSKEQEFERKPKMPFGKEPFKKRVHEDDEVYNRKQKQRRREQEDEERRIEKQNERNNQKPGTPGNQDDEVWNQIFPKQKPTQKPIAKKPSNTNQPAPNKVTQNQSIMGDKKNREYEKPWLKNANNNNKNDKNNKQGGKEERKTFAKHVYPNGDGPDTHLIETLERQVVDFNPNITFDDIAELTKAKDILQEAVLLPLNFPELFTGNRRAWKGVMLFGPPGTGKTLLAKAVASSGATTFFNVTASSLASKWRGQSQKMVRLLFEMAKFYAPTTIFIDEIDCIASARGQKQDQASRKVKTQLMTRLDGCTTGEEGKLITLIAATNRPWDLDDAILRRLEKRVYIPLPSEVGRRQLLKINLKNQKLQNVDLEQVVRKTEGYSGADIANLCREAAYMPMRRKLKSEGGLGNKLKDPAWKEQFKQQVNIPLTMDDFIEALKNVKPSVGQKGLQQFIQWGEQFGEKGTN